MGHNRAGVKARLKLRRRRKEEARLARKAAVPEEKPSGGVVQKVKELAEGAVKKVGKVMEAAAHKIKDAVR